MIQHASGVIRSIATPIGFIIAPYRAQTDFSD